MTGRSRIRALAAAVALASGLGLTACGDDDETQQASCDGSPEPGARELVYEVREEGGASPAQLSRTAEILCRRTEVLGVEGAVVRADGPERITVFLPEGAPGGVGDELDRAARLRFYDWEANVIGAPGTSDPGARPIASFSEARRLASQRDGAIVIRAEPPRHGFFVIRNRALLRNENIRSLEQGVDPATGNPTIGLDFTDRGRRRFEQLTRQIAERSKEGSAPHYAVVVDAEVVALPTVDTAENPNGVDVPGVSLVGAITVEEAETLAKFLEIGHLPIDLRLAPP